MVNDIQLNATLDCRLCFVALPTGQIPGLAISVSMISDRNRIAPCSFPSDARLSSLYQQPNNIIEIALTDPREHVNGKDKFVDYAISCKTNLPHFRIKSSLVRRRYKQFCLLKDFLAREAADIYIPELPSKSFLTDRYSPEFIQERMKGMEKFIQE